MPRERGSHQEKDPLSANEQVRKRVPSPARVIPERREKLRERAECCDRGES
ncbi:MAG: hypothetical protein M3O88_08210 [Actinomycetota bacterium]|nr:hypothetical protein [Actinomycetota bacterium]